MTAPTLDRRTIEPLADPVDRLLVALRSEPAVLVGLLVTIGAFYLLPWTPVRLLGLALFFVLTVYRPALQLALVPVAAPLLYRQQPIFGLYFPLPEIIIVVAVGAWVVRDGWTLLRTRALPDLRVWVRNPVVLIAAALAVIGVIWLLVPPAGEARKVALREFRWTVLEPVLFFGLMLRWLRTERDIWRMVGAWMLAAALVAREGVEQFLLGETWSMEGVGRVSSVFPSATAFGIYLGRPLAVGIVLALFLPREWKWWRMGAGLLSVVIGLGTLFSFARGAWIGVFVALVVVAIVAWNKRLMVALGAVVVLGLAALPFIKVERITSMFDFSTQDNTGVARGKIWSAALRIIADHPFTGIGQDQFLRQDPSYGVPQMRFFQTSHPHDWILDFWLRLGLPGLAWAFVALGYFFWEGIRLFRRLRGTAAGALVLALIASMVDFAMHGLLDMAYFTMDLALTFWLTFGLLVLIRRRATG